MAICAGCTRSQLGDLTTCDRSALAPLRDSLNKAHARMISRYLCVCLLLDACRIEKDRSVGPARTARAADDNGSSYESVAIGSLWSSLRQD